MSIILTQTDRTENSVTFSISGVTGDRKTYVWMPMMSTNGQWISLSDAYSLSYIKDFSTTDDRNGEITVTFYSEDAEEYKVWQFYVYNYVGSDVTDASEMLNTILYFDYDYSSTKYPGDTIDITVNDLRRINLFAMYIYAWIIWEDEEGCQYYPLDDADSGYSILADYLVLPAQNIYNAANYLSSSYYNYLSDRSYIKSIMSDITDNCYSGSPFYAEYFNNIKYAINNFNLETT